MSALTEYRDLEQGTEDWLEARRGILTASTIGGLITPTLKVASNETSRGLIAQLVAERITGWVEPVYVSPDMMRGNFDEPLARDLYARTFAPVEQIGFMVLEVNGNRLGFSPDGLVGADGLIEVKSRKPKKHVQTILADEVPPENMAQIQAGLRVSGRAWCDYISYCGGMPMWVKRVTPNPEWFAAIDAATLAFEADASAYIATYEARTKGLPVTERSIYDMEIEV